MSKSENHTLLNIRLTNQIETDPYIAAEACETLNSDCFAYTPRRCLSHCCSRWICIHQVTMIS